jgi:hypothetical protein
MNLVESRHYGTFVNMQVRQSIEGIILMWRNISPGTENLQVTYITNTKMPKKHRSKSVIMRRLAHGAGIDTCSVVDPDPYPDPDSVGSLDPFPDPDS